MHNIILYHGFGSDNRMYNEDYTHSFTIIILSKLNNINSFKLLINARFQYKFIITYSESLQLYYFFFFAYKQI